MTLSNNSIPFHKVDLSNGKFVLFDTSFVLNLSGYNNNAPIKQECDDFVWKIAISKSAFAITTITEKEIYEIFLTNGYNSHFNKKYTEGDIKSLRRDQPHILEAILSVAQIKKEATIDLLKESPFYWGTVGEINNTTLNEAYSIQRKYILPGFNDALQLAIANHNSEIFAATDKDFNSVVEDKLIIAVDEKTSQK